ncbi:hypothetical protein SteCoe_32127 [Stentor coeruleus]|uniref:ODAD1 central coiled coil region domain-containing protein n=1 Tax=Stentor coeruleus TaxID=5963 RepID=A0A1R2AZR2_9CILI|nr:hypothetical protein SteCoe_32127 [Stentor coeruleus]
MSQKPQNRVSETSNSTSRKARLEMLKQEAFMLRTQIDFSSSDPTTMMINSDIYRLQDQSDTFSRKIITEKKIIEELRQQHEALTSEIDSKRKQSVEIAAKNKSNSDSFNRKVKSIENKIDKGLQKLNGILAINKGLIEKINKIRKERMIYSNMCKQLESELAKKQEEMKLIVEASNQAIKEREETKKKLGELKQEAEKENEEFESEWRTLEKHIIRDTTSKDFLKEPIQAFEEEEKVNIIECEVEVRATQGKVLIDEQNEKLKQYEEELKMLTEKTNLKSLDEIVKVYLDSEMQNFSLFNHVNELSGEMEQLDLQIAEIRDKIDKHKVPDTENDIERKNMIKEYQLKLEKLALKDEEFSKASERVKKTLNSLVDGVRVLCDRLNIEFEEIDEKNLINLFAEVEKKLDERINDKKLKNIKANTENIKKIDIDTPMIMDRDDEEDVGFEMTTDEIRYKSLRKLNEENEKRFRRK